MQRQKVVLTILLAVGLAACGTLDVSATFDESVDFSKYTTYEWVPRGEFRKADAMAQNPEADRLIREIVDRDLESKGFMRREDDGQLRIDYITGITDALGQTTWGYGYGGQSYPGGGMITSNRRDAVLLLDIIDKGTGKKIWKGRAADRFEGFEDASEKGRNAIVKLLALFPPKGN